MIPKKRHSSGTLHSTRLPIEPQQIDIMGCKVSVLSIWAMKEPTPARADRGSRSFEPPHTKFDQATCTKYSYLSTRSAFGPTEFERVS